jgi:hypothetical protein
MHRRRIYSGDKWYHNMTAGTSKGVTTYSLSCLAGKETQGGWYAKEGSSPGSGDVQDWSM